MLRSHGGGSAALPLIPAFSPPASAERGLDAGLAPGSRRREQSLDRNLEPWRIELHGALREDACLDRIARPTLVVNDDPPVGVEDEIVLDARQREIAAELAAVINRRRARGQHFDHDDWVLYGDGLVSTTRAADHRGVRLESLSRIDLDGEAIGERLARQT